MTIEVTYRTKSYNTYLFQITLDDGDENTYTFLPQKLYPFQYGNDEKIDSILYPDNVRIKFSIYGAGINVHSGYYTLINKLSFIAAEVVITKNGSEYMRGYIDQMNVGGEYESRSVEVTVLGNFGKLKEIDPRTLDPDDIADSTPVNGAAPCAFFTEAITETIKLVMPNITQTILSTDLKATTTYTFLSVPYDSPADNWGDFAYRIWGPNSNYGATPEDSSVFTAAQLIKNILASFGCVGIVKDNKFIMQSRLYFPGNVEGLLKKNYVRSSLPEPFNQQKIDGLQIFVRPNELLSVEYEALFGTVKKDENGALKEPDRVETSYFYVCGGDPPGIDGNIYPLLVRKMYCYIPGFVAGIGNEIWDLAKRNECYSSVHPTKGPVWKVVADSIWSDSSIDRLAYKVKSLGFGYDYEKFYQLEDDPNAYRPRMMSFDENTYSTELDLLRLTDEVQEFEPETDYSLRDKNGVLLYDTDDTALYSAIPG
ncbi:YbaB/EbfC family nucleoid-associated protein [bacterium]|nr:YbaB/EbfC family nucleoid-associated protein [bacterium]